MQFKTCIETLCSLSSYSLSCCTSISYSLHCCGLIAHLWTLISLWGTHHSIPHIPSKHLHTTLLHLRWSFVYWTSHVVKFYINMNLRGLVPRPICECHNECAWHIVWSVVGCWLWIDLFQRTKFPKHCDDSFFFPRPSNWIVL